MDETRVLSRWRGNIRMGGSWVFWEKEDKASQVVGLPWLASQYCFLCHLQTLSNPSVNMAQYKSSMQKKWEWERLWHVLGYLWKGGEVYVAGERIDYVKLGGLVGSSWVWKEGEHALFLQVKSMSGLGCVLISISSVKKKTPNFQDIYWAPTKPSTPQSPLPMTNVWGLQRLWFN